jgi:hypothetical protein
MIYRQLISALILMILAFTANAQRGQLNIGNERIQSLKVAFITEKLNFTPEESATFWPLYNEMEEKIKEIKKSPIKKARAVESDNDAKEFILETFSVEEEAISTEKEYYLLLAEKISAQKVMKLNQVENQFKRELLKEVRNRRTQRSNR